jgi:biopolymer transport protein ExbB
MDARRAAITTATAFTAMLAASLASAAEEAIDAAPIAADAAIPTTSLWQVLLAGGPLVIPIFVCSFVLLLVVFERAMALRRSRVIPKLFVERFLLQISEGAVDRQAALEL